MTKVVTATALDIGKEKCEVTFWKSIWFQTSNGLCAL
jgi:hypothetical protein